MVIVDRYTKFILTLIAIALLLIALNPWIVPEKAHADMDNSTISNFKQIKSAVDSMSSSVDSISSTVNNIEADVRYIKYRVH